LTTLQAKMASVKGELKDAFEETALAKHNEDLARAAAAKTLAQQTALRAEIEQLRDQMDQMREEREQEAAAKGSKHNQEAVIRRLDNERQYLKSQLASEITLKNELHEALSACQTQLSETQAQWRSDVEALKETTAQTVRDSALAQQRLHQTALTLEAEVAALSSQNKELKEGFTKMRDQVRLSLPLPLPPTHSHAAFSWMSSRADRCRGVLSCVPPQVRAEQLSLEAAAATNRKLLEQVELARADAVRTQQALADKTADHDRQVHRHALTHPHLSSQAP